MMATTRFFGLFCRHKWVVTAEGERIRTYRSGATRTSPFRELQCENCGDVKAYYFGGK